METNTEKKSSKATRHRHGDAPVALSADKWVVIVDASPADRGDLYAYADTWEAAMDSMLSAGRHPSTIAIVRVGTLNRMPRSAERA